MEYLFTGSKVEEDTKTVTGTTVNPFLRNESRLKMKHNLCAIYFFLKR
jgi:hypothetical protein